CLKRLGSHFTGYHYSICRLRSHFPRRVSPLDRWQYLINEIRHSMKKSLLLLIACILISTTSFAQGSKIEFWNKQRKGANWFNRVPTKDWLIAARQANL